MHLTVQLLCFWSWCFSSWGFGCRCSAERVASVLSQYPTVELMELTGDDGQIRATCEFCSTAYSFAPEAFQAAQT